MINAYRTGFEKIKLSAPADDDMSIVLIEYDYDQDFEDEQETCIDVSGRNDNEKSNESADSYAIELST
jgi:hypothetical protein